MVILLLVYVLFFAMVSVLACSVNCFALVPYCPFKVGYRLFGDNHQDPTYKNFADAYTFLFVGITTANYPDVSLPAYNRHRAAGLFYIIFMFFGVYFILNLFLAVVYEKYTDLEKSKFQRITLHQRRALYRAFAFCLRAQRCESPGNEGLHPGLHVDANGVPLPVGMARMHYQTFSQLMHRFLPSVSEERLRLTFEYLKQVVPEDRSDEHPDTIGVKSFLQVLLILISPVVILINDCSV
jgi:hypothetical protein